jgi:hypothetical protein
LGQDADWTDRCERGELVADPAQLATEAAAPGAVAHVATSHRVRPHSAIVGDDQLLSDLRAGRISRFRGAGQRQPRPDQQ